MGVPISAASTRRGWLGIQHDRGYRRTRAMAKRRLPIGIQTFREIRESDCYYVDKTGYALRLVGSGKHFFLSRPRRFGKSLFLDTLQELFAGRRELFEGLEAYERWDWSVSYPVVRLDFAGGDFAQPEELLASLGKQLDRIEEQAKLERRYDTGPGRLADLLERLHDQTGQRVVVLVDEYDKPILDALGQPEIARANRDFLRGLYGMIKSCDAHIRFCFLTGVSKFSKVRLFSGLNNLRDITLDPAYSAICGYTDTDLDTVFAPELQGLDRERIREWYNGYSWDGKGKVYNPFDVLLLFAEREFSAWWFETGTPTFLTKLLTEHCVAADRLDGLNASRALLSTFDVGRIAPEALLFQTGYLTIGGRERRDDGFEYFRLGVSEPRGAPKPQPELAELHHRRPKSARAAQSNLAAAVASGRHGWAGGVVPRFVCRHPVSLAQSQHDRRLRGLLCQRVLQLLRRLRCNGDAGGQRQHRACGPSGAGRGQNVRVRVQGLHGIAAGRGIAATKGTRLRGQVPSPRTANPFGGSGVQRADTERGSVRQRTCQRSRLTLTRFRFCVSLDCVATCQSPWPFIVRWPGEIPANTLSADTVRLGDLFATIAAVIDEPLPPAREAAEDSFNIFPARLAQSLPRPLRGSMILHSVDGNFAVREGSWKYVGGRASPTG